MATKFARMGLMRPVALLAGLKECKYKITSSYCNIAREINRSTAFHGHSHRLPCTLQFNRLMSDGKRSVHHGRASTSVEESDKSDSDSDSDNEEIPQNQLSKRALSNFWRRKMRTIHSHLDVNKDGVISFDDFKLLSDRFAELGHLSEKSKEEFQQLMQNMWEEQWGDTSPYNLVGVEQYLEEMHHVLEDKALRKKYHNFLPFLFKAVDKDGSGEISVEEFKLFFKCLGLKNEDAAVSFSYIDANEDGKISLKEFVKIGRDYFLTQDPNRPSKHFWGPLVD